MSRAISPVTNKPYGLKRVCTSWGVARSTLYRHRREKHRANKRGPKPIVSEEMLLKSIREDIVLFPFKGEGHRKTHARLKRQEIRSSRNPILRVMRENQLLSPHRTLYRPPTPHDRRITTDRPDVMWGSDGTKVLTIEDG